MSRFNMNPNESIICIQTNANLVAPWNLPPPGEAMLVSLTCFCQGPRMRIGGTAQVVEGLASKHQALNSNPRSTKEKKKKEKRL
jgi:hypothetical protein